MEPFKGPTEHLDAVLAFVNVLVERQIVAHWETGKLARLDDHGGGEAALFGRVAHGTTAGANRVAELDHEIARLEGELSERATDADQLPLERVRQRFALSASEERVLAIAIAAEVSPHTRGLLRYLANDGRRPVLDRALYGVLVYGARGRADQVHELGRRSTLVDNRLLEATEATDSVMYAPIRASARLLELAYGVVRIDSELAGIVELVAEPPGFDAIVVSPELRAQLTGLMAGAGGIVATPAIILAGPPGCGRRTLLGATAHGGGRGALVVRCGDLPRDPDAFAYVVRAILREATLFGAMPIFADVHQITEEGERTRERLLDRALAGWREPIAATTSVGNAQPLKLARGTIVIEVPTLGEGEREAMWRLSLHGSAPDVDLANVAARFPVTPGMIVHASRAAEAVASARDAHVGDADLQLGLRSAMDEALAALGTRLTKAQRWEDLVATAEVMDALREFVARIQFRRRVYEDWGFADKYTKGLGLSAMFTGPPGTGKTMAATLIAARLGLDIYQVDVSKIVSKFIGETEKNLAQVFDAAEAGHAIILFDEADAMFASRGEVKSSVDRYANLEINYLLQRLERFAGITILTTNLAASIDPAFKRRISFTVEFPMPEEVERERIWKAHIPSRATIAADADFGWLAKRHVMSGGHIRNAVLRAAFLAAAEGGGIRFEHLRRAAEVEAQAMGRVV